MPAPKFCCWDFGNEHTGAVACAAACLSVCRTALPWVKAAGECGGRLWHSVTCSWNVHCKATPVSDKGVTSDFGLELKRWSSQITSYVIPSQFPLFYHKFNKYMLVKTIHESTLRHTSCLAPNPRKLVQIFIPIQTPVEMPQSPKGGNLKSFQDFLSNLSFFNKCCHYQWI